MLHRALLAVIFCVLGSLTGCGSGCSESGLIPEDAGADVPSAARLDALANPGNDDAAMAANDDAAEPDDAKTVIQDDAAEPATDDAATPANDDAATAADDDAATAADDDAATAADDDAAIPADDDAAIAANDDAAIPANDDAETFADAEPNPDAAPPFDGGPSIDFNNLTWSVRNVIDPRATEFGRSQLVAPRNLRGLALSNDRRYLYAGYLNGSASEAEVRQIDLTVNTTVSSPFVASVIGIGAKAIAVDDVGRVYVAGESALSVLTSSLSEVLFSFACTARCEGVAVTRELGALILYVSDRDAGTVERRRLIESGRTITAALLEGLGGTGELVVDRTGSLRNIAIDPIGRLWMVALATNRIYRVNADGTGFTWAQVNQPFDIDFDGPYVIITHNLARTLTRIERDFLFPVAPAAAPPWNFLRLDPIGPNNLGALTGLVVIPDVGFYVSHESGSSVPIVDPNNGSTFRLADPVIWAEGP